MFRLEQPEIKISKSFQIKTKYAFVRRYPNGYTKLKSCPFMYITDWIPACILSARARGWGGGGGQLSTLYMYGQCTLFRAVWVAFLVAKCVFFLMNLDILFSGCPRWNIVKENDISTLCIHGKEKENVLSQIYAS